MPSTDSTLLDVMLGHARTESDTGLYVWNTSSRGYDCVAYGELVRRAFAFGAALTGAGSGADRVCLIACHSPYATLVAFYGAVSAGATPMIFPMPTALGSQQALVERIRHWRSRLGGRAALVLESGLTEKFHQHLPDGLAVLRINPDPMGRHDRAQAPATARPPEADEAAFFQTTSSSTGDHKAVAVAHANVLANVRAIKAAVGMDESERMVSWLPLYHDMGLVGAALFTFCHDYPLYIMTPTQFIKRPLLWLRTMDEGRCSLTTAPNFGYDYCTRLVSDKDAAALDLSCSKHLFIGAEPVRVGTIRAFCTKFAAAGVGYDNMRVAYGLAESTLCTSISRPGARTRFLHLDPDSIGMNRRVRVVGAGALDGNDANGDEPSKRITVCTAGTPIPDMAVSVVDEEGSPVAADGCAGEIVIHGTSVAMGYVGEERRLDDEFSGHSVATGDMGVVIDGELYVIERLKNVIIRNGENFLVSAMELAVADMVGVPHDNVAVFEADIHDPSSEILVLIEKHPGLAADEIDPVLANLPPQNFPVDAILLHRSRVIPRTTSGKKRHFYCRKLYRAGQLQFQQRIEVTPDSIAAASLKAAERA